MKDTEEGGETVGEGKGWETAGEGTGAHNFLAAGLYCVL
jgi:hypothetical protein